MEGSRFQGAAANRKLRDHTDDSGEYEASDFDDGLISNAFYAVEFSADDGNGNGTVSSEIIHGNNGTTIDGSEEESEANERKELEILKVEEKEATSNNATIEKSLHDTDDAKRDFEERVLFQADD